MIVIIGIAAIWTYFFMQPGKVATQQSETTLPTPDPAREARYRNRILMAENYERAAKETKSSKDRVELLKKAHDARVEAAQYQ